MIDHSHQWPYHHRLPFHILVHKRETLVCLDMKNNKEINVLIFDLVETNNLRVAGIKYQGTVLFAHFLCRQAYNQSTTWSSTGLMHSSTTCWSTIASRMVLLAIPPIPSAQANVSMHPFFMSLADKSMPCQPWPFPLTFLCPPIFACRWYHMHFLSPGRALFGYSIQQLPPLLLCFCCWFYLTIWHPWPDRI